jgi:hypothetical protein
LYPDFTNRPDQKSIGLNPDDSANKVKEKCHAGSILFVIQHRARLEQDSSGMTSKYRDRNERQNNGVRQHAREVDDACPAAGQGREVADGKNFSVLHLSVF